MTLESSFVQDNMEPLNIKIRNFLAIEEADFDLQNLGLSLVTGEAGVVPEIAEFKGNFVKLHGDAISLDELMDLKECLLANGALSVEVVSQNLVEAPSVSSRSFMTLDEALRAYSQELKVDKDLDDLGKLLRSGQYGTSKYKN